MQSEESVLIESKATKITLIQTINTTHNHDKYTTHLQLRIYKPVCLFIAE